VLFDCSKARNVWLNCSLVNKVNSLMLNNNTATEITFVLLQELLREKAEQFSMNSWSLWKSRNLRIWHNISETSQAITSRARQMLIDWRKANNRNLNVGAAGIPQTRVLLIVFTLQEGRVCCLLLGSG